MFVLRRVPVYVVGFLSSELTLDCCILFSVMILIKFCYSCIRYIHRQQNIINRH